MTTDPEHVVCAWRGNSKTGAIKHDLQVTDQHFERASKVIQNVMQSLHETARNKPTEESTEKTEPQKLPCVVPKRKHVGNCSSSGGGTRTPDTRIMIPLL